MSAAAKTITALALAIAATACNRAPKQPQPVNSSVAMNDPATDIEALPPDESSATPTNQLANGEDNPDINASTANQD